MISVENISTEIEAKEIESITCIGEITPFKSMKLLKKAIGVTGIEVKATLPLYSLAFSGTYNRGKGVP